MRYLAKRPDSVNGGLLEFPHTVEDLFSQFWNVGPSNAPWTPVVNIVETPQAYILRAEMPGIDPDEVDVTLTGETLTIRGEKKIDEVHDEESWYLQERSAGRFERRFTLPKPVAMKGIEALAEHGILTIRVMKAQEAQPHRIKIQKS